MEEITKRYDRSYLRNSDMFWSTSFWLIRETNKKKSPQK
tara:strand:- start:83 stop:199 length:117 start_codon:yes stop_codon:yes gene_type:complete